MIWRLSLLYRLMPLIIPASCKLYSQCKTNLKRLQETLLCHKSWESVFLGLGIERARLRIIDTDIYYYYGKLLCKRWTIAFICKFFIIDIYWSYTHWTKITTYNRENKVTQINRAWRFQENWITRISIH